MQLGLEGRVAVVTGGSRGLGKAVVEELAAEGCRVALIARDAAACRAVAEDLSARGHSVTAFPGDVSSKQSVAQVFADIRQSLGDPEVLVFNNGGAPDNFFDDATDEDFLDAYTAQVMGLAWCVREVLPAMQAAGWGRIVTLGSICAKEPHRSPLPMVLHNVTRPAQLGLSKTLASDVVGAGITVNTIAIGAFSHDGQARQRAYEQLQKRGVDTSAMTGNRLNLIPAGRYGEASEVAALCAFLCSDRAGFITGQTVVIDGGQTRSLF